MLNILGLCLFFFFFFFLDSQEAKAQGPQDSTCNQRQKAMQKTCMQEKFRDYHYTLYSIKKKKKKI